MLKVAVVLLNYNGEKILPTFLPSVVEHSSATDTRIFVIDNASTDDSVDFIKKNYPTIEIITLDKNYGFADGYNLGLKDIDAEYFVLLNTDVEVTENWLQPMIDYLDQHTNTDACQPKILSYCKKTHFEHAGACGGFIDKWGYPLCRGRVMNITEEDNGQHDNICNIFWATGACLFIRKKSFIDNGGLDADFFAHMEEIDLCWRIKSRGGNIVCIPQSKVYHLGGGTLNVENPHKTYLNFRNNLLMLYKNLPDNRLKSVLRMRFLLDNVAMLKYLLTLDFGNAKAVWKAQRDFHKMKANFTEKRKENLQKSVTSTFAEMTEKSLIFNFFAKGKKTYNDYF